MIPCFKQSALGLTLTALFLSFASTGCARELVRVPGPVEYRDRLVLRPVPPELLLDHPIAVGGVAQCPQVAAQRRIELERCNADKSALRSMQEE